MSSQNFKSMNRDSTNNSNSSKQKYFKTLRDNLSPTTKGFTSKTIGNGCYQRKGSVTSTALN